MRLSIIAVISLFANAALAQDLPDPRLTPGVLNPDVTQNNIQQTICVKGYTKTIRPPAYYTNKLKKDQLNSGYAASYGNRVDTDPRNYEEDHFIPLSIGGNPTDERNLWPQPRASQWNSDKKDALEFVIFKMVCAGKISLFDAQSAVASNWIEAYKKYVGNDPIASFNGKGVD